MKSKLNGIIPAAIFTLSAFSCYSFAEETSTSTAEYQQAAMKMHSDMTVNYTGDADVDFVNGMIPHHQGAIDMAEIELKYGKDPKIRELANQVIEAQKKEIQLMNDWRNSKATEGSDTLADKTSTPDASNDAATVTHSAMDSAGTETPTTDIIK